jgi:hypothetical protein
MKRQSIALSLLLATLVAALAAGPVSADSGFQDYNGHRYNRYDQKYTPLNAKAYCEGLGGYLTSITSSGENTFVDGQVLYNNTAWIGATDSASEMTWAWMNGEPWSYGNWESGQPNDYPDAGIPHQQDYVTMESDGKWQDEEATDSLRFICEWDSTAVLDTVDVYVNENNDSYGDISPDPEDAWVPKAKGQDISYTMSPYSGRCLANIIVGTTSYGVGDTVVINTTSPYTYTFVNIQEQKTLKANFGNPRTVTTEISQGSGTVLPASLSTCAGSPETFTITAAPGYWISKVETVVGTNVNDRTASLVWLTGKTEAAYTFNPLPDNSTLQVRAYFTADPQITILTYGGMPDGSNYIEGEGGTVTPGTPNPMSVAGGSTPSFTFTPHPEYYLRQVSVNDSGVTTSPATPVYDGSSATYTFPAITADKTLKAYFRRLPRVTVAPVSPADGGTVSPDTPNPIVHPYNATPSYTITPNPGYYVYSLSGQSGSTVSTSLPNYAGTPVVYTFSALTTSDRTLTATFRAQPQVTITQVPGGTISTSDGNALTPGELYWHQYNSTPVYTITPDPDHYVYRVRVNGSTVTTSPASPNYAGAAVTYTFSAITGNRSITAEFTRKPQITIAPLSNGSISPSTPNPMIHNYNSTPVYTVTPDPDYYVQSVTVNGSGVTTSPATPNKTGTSVTYTFPALTSDKTIAAVFGEKPKITASAGLGGAITPPGVTHYTNGTNATYTFTPDLGLAIINVKVDGVNLGILSSYTFTNIQSDHTIYVEFMELPAITASSGANGTVSPAGETQYTPHSNATYIITPAVNYAVEDVKADGVSVGPVTGYTFPDVMADHTIEATFKIKPLITATPGVNGTITPAGPVYYNFGANQTYTITPDTGFSVGEVKVDGVSQGAVTTYTFNNIQANHSIEATFIPNRTITSSTGAGGTITPLGPTEVPTGGSKTFAVQANSGYCIQSVLVDGVSQGVIDSDTTSYTFLNVFADHTISATFRAKTVFYGYVNPPEARTQAKYLLTNAATGAVIAGPGSDAGGWNLHGTTVPIPCELTQVHLAWNTLNGWNEPADHDFTFPADSSSWTGVYSRKSYMLTTSSTGAGSGDVTPSVSAPNLYDYEAVVPITATPSFGSSFAGWEESGGCAATIADPASPTTTVTMLCDKTVTARFVTVEYVLTVQMTGSGTTSPAPGSYTKGEGEYVGLSATPATDWEFVRWEGDISTTDPMPSVLMNSSKTVRAVFQPIGGMDADGDGHYTPADCDDTNPAINPNAIEVCGNSVDENCDGIVLTCGPNDTDTDGDGFSPNQGDCNDANANVHPGANDTCGDGVDQDCYEGDRSCSSELVCADLSDVPLDTQVQAAPANIMFILDDSGSMDWEFVCPETDGKFNGYSYLYSSFDTQKAKWKSQWSGYNKLYFNPNVEYKPWPRKPNADLDNPRSDPQATGTYNMDTVYLTFPGANQRVTVRRESGHGSYTVADVVRIKNSGGTVVATIDNDTGASYFETGSWGDRTDCSYYNNEFRRTSTTDSTATWLLNVTTAGNYSVEVYLNRCATTYAPDAPFTLYYGPGQELTQRYDQRSSAGSSGWTQLGTGTFYLTPQSPVSITIPHYYTWLDADEDAVVDPGEVYLVHISGGQITTYRFTDSNNDNIVLATEITALSEAETPTAVLPKNAAGGLAAYTEARQNFVNWYSYYRKRNYTAKAAVGTVINEMQGVKIGLHTIWSRINQAVLPVKLTVAGTLQDKTDDLLNLLYTATSSGGTPLQAALWRAGQYYDADDGQSGSISTTAPWAIEEDGGACQQSFSILMTDGFWNSSFSSAGNADGDGNTIHDGAPFGDIYSNTLADVAMTYYEQDLNNTLPNMVPIRENDAFHKATQQHMETYTVAFGVFGTLDPNQWLDCPGVCPSWPSPGDVSSVDPRKIDDMFHAAVNGRGKFLNADNPQQLIAALLALKQDIERKIGSGSSVSINAQELQEGTVMYQGIYHTDTWAGDLRAVPIDATTGDVALDPAWSASQKLRDKLPTDRKIAASSGTTAVPFRYDSLPAHQKTMLSADEATARQIVDWVRGDISNDQNHGGALRVRTSKLGDIVHSAPNHYGSVLYVGANDGMMHGFDDENGEELFGFIPSFVFHNLASVSNPSYDHKYFVDNGTYIAPVGSETLLVGGLGKGGKGYYCLDITTPRPADEAGVAGMLQWEYPVTTDNDMGYSFSKAFIVNSPAGYVCIFGNGYDAANGKAVLYVLNAGTGALIQKIDTGWGNTSTDCNGLSTPVLIDVNEDFKVDYVYAGDLLGNLWKFDLTALTVSGGGTVSYLAGAANAPLFQARNADGSRQPITAMPDAMRHCDPSMKGYIVVFGTGRYLGQQDFSDISVQTMYGVWDWEDEMNELGGNGETMYLGYLQTPTGSPAVRTLSHLSNVTGLPSDITFQQQTVIAQVGDSRVLSNNLVDWYNPATGTGKHMGWYFDLPSQRERIIQDVFIRDAKAIFISSIPSVSPCAAGGDSIIHEVDACTGGRTKKPALDYNEDKQINEDDLVTVPDPNNPGQTVKAAPSSIRRQGMFYPPAILQMPFGDVERKYFATSLGTVSTLDEAAEQRGIFYWMELD